MKRFLLLCIPLLLCGCSLDDFKKVDANELIFNKNETKEEENIVKVPEYVDENPVKLSLYVDNSTGGLDKVTDTFKETWRLKRDIVVFGTIFSEEEQLASDYFQNIWKKYASNYENVENYKVGWYVNFKLTDGTEIDQMIFSPKDVDSFYDYLEIYLYDSANVPIGVWYSHLLEKNMTDKTIMTSMKLTAGSKFESIISPIKVMVFTYDGEDDFDENGYYKGNSKYIVQVYNEK